MPFEYLIAFKYLFKSKRQGFVSLISFISVAGVAVGVMALIVVLSVMSGFDRELKSKIVGVQPHIIVEQFSGLENVDGITKTIKNLNFSELKSITPFVQGQAIARSDSGAVGVVVKGINESESLDLFQKHMEKGNLQFDDVAADPSDPAKKMGRVFLGAELAHQLQAYTGDVVYLISPAFDNTKPEQSLKQIAKQAKNEPFVVSGIFRLGMNDFDTNLALISLKQAQNLYRLGNKVSGLSIRLSDVDMANGLKAAIYQKLGPDFRVRSWMDVNHNFFSALKVEKSVMTILLSLIILVAAFNIVSTLIMVVMEKKKDIGILRVLGATKGSVRSIFVIQGFFIGFVGVILGAVAGLALSYNLNPVADFLEKNFGLVVFPSDIYLFDRIPAEINLDDVAKIVGFALLTALLAGLYPAERAAQLVPVQALRYE